MIEGEAEYKGELVSLEETKNSLLTQAPSVTPMRATFSSADSVQNGSGVINAIHYRSAASLPLGGRRFVRTKITQIGRENMFSAGFVAPVTSPLRTTEKSRRRFFYG